MNAFEASTQSNLRSGEDGDDIDDEKLPKKIDNLIHIVEGLRKEIAEFKADQGSIEVTNESKSSSHFPIFIISRFSFTALESKSRRTYRETARKQTKRE